MWHDYNNKCWHEGEPEDSWQLGVAKLDMSCEPDTTQHEISRLWVEA